MGEARYFLIFHLLQPYVNADTVSFDRCKCLHECRRMQLALSQCFSTFILSYPYYDMSKFLNASLILNIPYI